MKHLFLYFFLFISVQLFSQKTQPLRVEVDVEDTDNNFVIPIGKEGVVFLQEPENTIKGNRSSKYWTLSKYNTDFKKTEEKDIEIPKKYTMSKYYYDSTQQALYMLFVVDYFVQYIYSYASGDFMIVKISLESLDINKISGKLDMPLKIIDLKSVDDNVTFGGYTVITKAGLTTRMCLSACGCLIPILFGSLSKTPEAYYINADFKTGKVNVKLLDQFTGVTRISDIGVNQKTLKTSVLVENVPDKLSYHINIIELNKKGEQQKSIDVSLNREHSIINARSTNINDKDMLLMGTYTKSRSNYKFYGMAGDITLMTQGLFIGKIVNDKPQFVKFYNFSRFKNFFAYLGTKGQQNVDKKIKKKKEKGVELSFDYNMIIHDVIEQNGTYIMVAEAFYPQYSYETYTDCDSKGCHTSTRRVFEGFRYTHAIVAGFNTEGELLWDNCIEIEDILTFQLKERVKVLPQENNTLALVYSYGGRVVSKVFSGNKTLSSTESEKIETNYPKDVVKENFASDIDFWYDNTMIAFGYQKIKNKDAGKGEKKKRKVFYFNKIEYK